MEISDVLIHIDESVGHDSQFMLEEFLREVHGIVSPRFSMQQNHLMFVAYDSDATSAAMILEKIHGQGYEAQIVAI